MKSKTVAALLALFLGPFGAHKFYLGQIGMGFLYLIFFWTFIPGIVGLIEFIVLLVMDDHTFNLKYNALHSTSSGSQGSPITQAPNIIINVPGGNEQGGRSTSEVDIVTQLEKLHQLRISGAISAEEFDSQKTRLLQSS